MTTDPAEADVIVIGAAELVAAGRSVLVLDQEHEQSLGGQAFWSYGGLFLVDSPEQRRMGIRDSRDLAWQDWLGTAGGTGPGGLEPFIATVRRAAARGLVRFAFRHRVDVLTTRGGVVTGAAGRILEPSAAPRGTVPRVADRPLSCFRPLLR